MTRHVNMATDNEAIAALKRFLDKISEDKVSEAKAILLQGKICANACDEHGMSLLQHAAYKGNKDMVQMLLDQGADVNGGHHAHRYTALHFAALSGKVEVCRLLLNYGANALATNSVNRTPSQMAAFVGNHACVSVINNFISKTEIDYYTKPSGLETEAKLPPLLAEPLHKFVTESNMHPVKVAMNLKKWHPLYDDLDRVKKVIELMSEKEMKKTNDANEIMSFKLHYFSCVVEEVSKLKKNVEKQLSESQEEEPSKKSDAVELFIKKMLKVDRSGDTPEQNSFLVDSVRSFHSRECALFRQLVATLARSDAPSPVTVIMGAVNGQRAFADTNTECWTCGEDGASKKCSKCKDVRYCDRECQRLHWFVHKKNCNRPTTSPERGTKVNQATVVEAVQSQLANTVLG